MSVRSLSLLSPSEPLFLTTDRQPLSRTVFIESLRALLLRLGLNPEHYAGHSFRISATTSAEAANIPRSSDQNTGTLVKRLLWTLHSYSSITFKMLSAPTGYRNLSLLLCILYKKKKKFLLILFVEFSLQSHSSWSNHLQQVLCKLSLGQENGYLWWLLAGCWGWGRVSSYIASHALLMQHALQRANWTVFTPWITFKRTRTLGST